MKVNQKDVQEILDIGISLSTEKDRNKLLEKILNESMKLTNADAGTVYVMEDDKKLYFRIMKTLSMKVSRGTDGDVIDLPPVPLLEENVCAYSAIHRVPINIENVYDNDMFDFSGPKNYDKITGYKTTSMLVIPLANYEDEIIGVIQLINSMQGGEVVPFEEEAMHIITSLASEAAVAISNMKYTEELKEQMWSFTRALAVAIDERSPYNARHTEKVAFYVEKMADYIEAEHRQGKFETGFDQRRKDEIIMAAWLHDVGKMLIPLDVMNKKDRMGKHMVFVENRFELFKCYTKIHYLEKNLSEEEYKTAMDELDDCINFVRKLNSIGFITEEDIAHIQIIKNKCCTGPDGEKIPYFTDEEIDCMEIKRGTLTDDERHIMENHVVMTRKFLENVHFNSYFRDCSEWASNHHERLDGRGYPNHLKGDELSLESRIISVADVYDALTSVDRPYKKPIPKDKAFNILEEMAENGALDKQIIGVLKSCLE